MLYPGEPMVGKSRARSPVELKEKSSERYFTRETGPFAWRLSQ